ncbi:unnamed protein product [Caenorhabditis brenneri]
MRVVLIQKAEDVIAELFGPIQEAARKPFLFGKFFQFFLHINACFIDLNPTEVWCELAELRLSSLVCEYKPVGINRNFHLLAIHERMHKIFDNEPPQFEIYLSDKNKVLFRKQQNDLLLDETTPRTTYPPKYSCRPTLEMINEKLGQWFGMKVCEENESDPPGFSEHSDYTLPEYIMEERLPGGSPLVERVIEKLRDTSFTEFDDFDEFGGIDELHRLRRANSQPQEED